MSLSPAATSDYVLPPLPYTRLRFILRATEPSTLPPFKGSLLRGGFGHALRRVACAMGPEQPCESCRLRAACVYTRIFETYVEGEPPPFLQGLPDAPRPYVFELGTEALWAYLVVFHVLHGKTKRAYYEDGRRARVLVAAHG